MAGCPPEDRVTEFVGDTHRLTVYELCEKYDRRPSTIKDWRKQLEVRGYGTGLGPPATNSKVPSYNDWARIEGDVMLIGDLEIPYHDAENLNLMLEVARRWGIRTLVVNGDFVCVDWLSSWAKETGEHGTDDENEAGPAREVVAVLESAFDTIYFIKGNHEQRATRGKLNIKNLFRTFGVSDISKVSDYKYCEVVSSTVPFLVVHPEDYSSVRAKVAVDLSVVEDANVITSHTHLGGISFSPNGKYICADLGHSTRRDTRYYAMQGKRKSPRWISGFGMIRKGKYTPFYKDFTDWDLS